VLHVTVVFVQEPTFLAGVAFPPERFVNKPSALQSLLDRQGQAGAREGCERCPVGNVKRLDLYGYPTNDTVGAARFIIPLLPPLPSRGSLSNRTAGAGRAPLLTPVLLISPLLLLLPALITAGRSPQALMARDGKHIASMEWALIDLWRNFLGK
jgi:hypothetical protein